MAIYTIENNETLLLIGENGVGKSKMIQIIFIKPDLLEELKKRHNLIEDNEEKTDTKRIRDSRTRTILLDLSEYVLMVIFY